MLLLFFTVLACIDTANGIIEPIPLPESLDKCIYNKVELNKGSGIPLHVIQNLCLGKFITMETPHNWARNLTNEEQNYMQSLIRKTISESEVSLHGNRFKRDVLPSKRYRREIRSGNYKHWEDYAKAVMRLKYQEIGPNGRSRYDTIADIHMTAINSSHSGPNFLSWHRLYLLVFESALGVPIPYWDSTIDYEMDDPTQSVLFTERYFGNGFGMVKTGPFANFETPAGHLIRNIGSDGSLFNKRDLNAIFTRKRLVQILEPTAEERVSLEGQHNSVHNWVDGQMNTQEFSPHDPLFWTHHSFVDYLWEEFRKTQLKRGVDPVIDIPEPPENVTFQGANDPSVGLFGFYNRDGYTTRIAKMVNYEPHPECPKCGGGPELTCDTIRGLCISSKRNPMEYSGSRDEAQAVADAMIEITTGRKRGVFSEYMRDSRVRGDSLTMKDNKQFSDYSLTIGKGIPIVRSYHDFTIPSSLHKQEILPLDKQLMLPGIKPFVSEIPHMNVIGPRPYLHTPKIDFSFGSVHPDSVFIFPDHNRPVSISGHGSLPYYKKPNFSGMKYTPFSNYLTDFRTRGDSMTLNRRMSYLRKRRSLKRNALDHNSDLITWEPKLQNSFFLDGKTDLSSWAFVPVKVLYNNITGFEVNRLSGQIMELQSILGDTKTKCGMENKPLKVYIQSHGLNYFGKYKDYVTLKNQNSDINFVGIKRPIGKAIETYISAYDSCGNICSSRCIVPGITPPIYKSCTGAVRVSEVDPLMYIDVPYNFQTMPSSENYIPIIFSCDN